MLTKTILSIGVAVALVGFAAPSVASADIWTLDGVPIGESTAEGVTFDGTGEIAFTRITGVGKVRLGPCVVHVHGTFWNNPETGTGHGEIDNFDITEPCDVSLGGTKICTITNIFSASFPWTIEVTAGTGIDITGFNFSNVFSAGCPLGPGVSVSGIATSQWSNEGPSISFNESGHLQTPDGSQFPLDGSIGITPVEGETLALE